MTKPKQQISDEEFLQQVRKLIADEYGPGDIKEYDHTVSSASSGESHTTRIFEWHAKEEDNND